MIVEDEAVAKFPPFSMFRPKVALELEEKYSFFCEEALP